MHISATIPLILGTVAGILFIAVFLIAACVTFRNRRLIRNHSQKTKSQGSSFMNKPALKK